MDSRLKPYTSTCTVPSWHVKKHNLADRLSSLPEELLIRILSLLPTKDAAAISILSTRLLGVFRLITSLEFDVSSISLCVNRPCAGEKYPKYVNFVTSVLQGHQSEYLTRFQLKVGSASFRSRYYELSGCGYGGCRQNCLPDLKPFQLNAWISFPLTHCGLKELELSILVSEPGDAQLPPSLFNSQTLEVLRLEVNIGIDQVLAMPSYSLPRLKLLSLLVSYITDEGFLPRLLESCPLLEDLEYEPFTEHVHRLVIVSRSLRKLYLRMNRTDEFQFDNGDFVYIDTPNLEQFVYDDNSAFHYSIQVSQCLVKARLWVVNNIQFGESFLPIINLIRPVSHVQHLSLSGYIASELDDVDENVLKDQLPMFPNMKHLSIDGAFIPTYWDRIILPLLNCSPVLETLVIEYGIAYVDEDWDPERNELEIKFFRRAHPVPKCCRYNLKTIVFMEYKGKQREVEFLQFLLRHALVLENLTVHCAQNKPHIPAVDQPTAETTLRTLSKASSSCLIQVL